MTVKYIKKCELLTLHCHPCLPLSKQRRSKPKRHKESQSQHFFCYYDDELHYTPTSFHELINIPVRSLLPYTTLSFSFYMPQQYDPPPLLPSRAPWPENDNTEQQRRRLMAEGEWSRWKDSCKSGMLVSPSDLSPRGLHPYSRGSSLLLTHGNQEPARQVPLGECVCVYSQWAYSSSHTQA